MVVSFGSPEYTVGVDAIGTLQMLEVIRFLGLQEKLDFISLYSARCSASNGKLRLSDNNADRGPNSCLFMQR